MEGMEVRRGAEKQPRTRVNQIRMLKVDAQKLHRKSMPTTLHQRIRQSDLSGTQDNPPSESVDSMSSLIFRSGPGARIVSRDARLTIRTDGKDSVLRMKGW